MKTKIKLQKENPILTRVEAEAAISEYAGTAINLQRTTAKMDAEVAAIRDRYQSNLDVLNQRLELLTEVLCDWAQTNPLEFPKGQKSIQFANGKLGFRTGTPKLALASRSWTWDKVLSAVQGLLPNFIRNKPEVDKEAILAQRDELAEYLPSVGLKVTQSETFFVEPALTEVETRLTTEAA